MKESITQLEIERKLMHALRYRFFGLRHIMIVVGKQVYYYFKLEDGSWINHKIGILN